MKAKGFLRFVILMLLVCVAFQTGKRTNHIPTFISRTDTITRIDTIRVVSPPIVTTQKLRDTIYIRDTILLREQAIYKDSFFIAYVSGFQPRLDSITFFRPTQTITRTIRKNPRFHFGPSIGYGLNGAFIGVSLSYSLISF